MNSKFWQLAFVTSLLAVPVFVFYDIGTRFAEKGVNTGSAENNAAMYPRLVALLLLGLLFIQLARTVMTPAGNDDQNLFNPGIFLKEHAKAITVFAIFLAYLWAFRWLGFLYSTPIFLFLTQLTLGLRNLWKIGLYSGGVTAIVYLAFSKLLNLALPAGDFFG